MLGVGFAFAGLAEAQDSTTGAVRGQILDKDSGEPIIGATVVATSPALQGTQASISEEDGGYYLPNLPSGMYIITVYHLDAEFSRDNVLVQLGKAAKVNIRINADAAAGETIAIQGSAPIIDQASTKTGATITSDYTENIPTGRTFGAVLGAAAGSAADTYGTSFGGSTSVENVYIVDGVNTTDPGYGQQTSTLPNEFIKETELITGGYKAEYGRATGGIVNVVTKTGSNEFQGSVFGYWTPGGLVATPKLTPSSRSSIDNQDQLENSFDFGAEVGGPIIKDRLWFHLGMNPSFSSTNRHRIVRSRMDDDQDGSPDVDDNGFIKLGDELDRRTFKSESQRYFYTAKLTGAINPDHQGTLGFSGNPRKRKFAGSVSGTPEAGRTNEDRNILDASFKWTSKFFDGASQLDVVAGAHQDTIDESPRFDVGNMPQVRYDPLRPLTDFRAVEGAIPAGCEDGGAGDLYPSIANCPVTFYRTGGVGLLTDTDASRLSGRLDWTQRAKFLGRHTFKAGFDIEEQGYKKTNQFSGGKFFRQRTPTIFDIQQYYGVDSEGSEECGNDLDGDGVREGRCSARDAITASTSTRNMSAYLQDDWSLLPNLILNAGIRWEQQEVFAADEVAGQLSPTSGEPIPKTAFNLKNMFAPRLGVIYDPSQEGRSRLFGSWGRFYESIPMDINVRAYGGEITNINRVRGGGCSADVEAGPGCDENDAAERDRFFLGGGEEVSVPNLKAQFMDEFVVGGEYELFSNFKIGGSFVRRKLGRIIEDVSNDGGNTYLVANPGSVDTAGIQSLRDEAADIRNNMNNSDFQERFTCGGDADPAACMMKRAAFREFKAEQFSRVGEFDTPYRTYQALQLTAERRFTDTFFLQASYTYSKLRGNYPGLFSPETGQLDPNLTSMYDLPDLMANRFGDLAGDVPHNLKVDSFYKIDAGKVGTFTVGNSVRVSSGAPHSALGAHPVYGNGESYILPRGGVVEVGDGEDMRRVGRSPTSYRVDARLGYGRPLSDGMYLEAFVDLFNVLNVQRELDREEIYTFDFVNPIVGGDSEDLKHL